MTDNELQSTYKQSANVSTRFIHHCRKIKIFVKRTISALFFQLSILIFNCFDTIKTIQKDDKFILTLMQEHFYNKISISLGSYFFDDDCKFEIDK